ncbi:uncharacterized protein METZ01_LOCUS300664, partial [marine metagenome]
TETQRASAKRKIYTSYCNVELCRLNNIQERQKLTESSFKS